MQMRRVLRYLLFTGVGIALGGVVALLVAYLYVNRTLPKVDTLADYRPPIISRVYSDDGAVIAEFSRERRIIVPVSRMPRQLIEAFVSAEDSNFFQHKGIDLVSIARAALKNIKAGGIVQGGSTITQQVAKSLLLTPERKFSRKFKEAILASRMERTLSKDGILHLYLNQIYLGHGAYGVQAAAENYFDKNVEELSLAECAILAGLPQAPSRYSPYRHFDRARERQKYVLGRMVDERYVTAEEAAAALEEEVVIHQRTNSHIRDAAYFTEQVRRYLEETYGKERLYNEGLEVYTSMNLAMQLAAQKGVQDNLHDHDRRHGYRGPEKVLTAEETESFLVDQQEGFARKAPQAGAEIEGVLSGSGQQALQVRFGDLSGEIPLKQIEWAGPVKVVEGGQEATGNALAEQTRLPVGSLLRVRLEKQREDGGWILRLQQQPLAQGALVALDPHTGQLKAMVGGYDFLQSQFNRVIQARRLPGSAIKPIVYAAALDKGYTPATMILDTPLIYRETKESGEETEWKPRNYGKKFYGPTSFRTALTKSMNVITIKVLEDIGVGYAANYTRKLGITSPLARDLTLGLGSSAVTPLELATAYCVFANGGVRITPSYINRIVDRDGRVLESTDPADFPGGPTEDQRLIRLPAERVISPETAYLATNLMESVVRSGTGWRARELDRPTAGKTGTTNDLKDAWFAGFVPQLVAVSWVGYDQERPLGKKETGSKAAAPAWVAFMKEAVKDMPPHHFPVPDTIEFRTIDPVTGLLAPEDSPEAYVEVFAPGTAPTRYALDEQQPTARDFFKLDIEGE